MRVSAIIPVYNEEKVVKNCLDSLKKQTIDCEAIIVDDGSTDSSAGFANCRQNHQGPGAARNLGAAKATGDVLVFVDADMEFEPDFIEKLIDPITTLPDGKQVIGTYSTDEFLLNKDKPFARCWNQNFGRSIEKMDPRGYSTKATGIYKLLKNILEKFEGKRAGEEKNRVFRAILREKFLSVGGFDVNVGYTDDWSLSQKLNDFPAVAKGAIYYHRSPDNLPEIWRQARWYGKNEFLTKNIVRRIYNLVRYFPPLTLLYIFNPTFFVFKIVFNTAVFTSVVLSFFGEQKAR